MTYNPYRSYRRVLNLSLAVVRLVLVILQIALMIHHSLILFKIL